MAARALQEALRLPEAIAEYEAVLARDPANAEAGSARLLCLNYAENISATDLRAAHDAYGRAHPPAAPSSLVIAPVAPAGLSALPSRPLRVAFLSPDLRRHAVASFVGPLLAPDPHELCISLGGLLLNVATNDETNGGAFEDGVIGLKLEDLSIVAVLSDNAIDVSRFSASDGRGGRISGGERGRPRAGCL